jgi:SAM-dependent methyltransferase
MNGRPDEALQRASFNGLVEQGVYSSDFEHPPFLQRFFADTLEQHSALGREGGQASVLDCGCGTGAWLSLAQHIGTRRRKALRLFGFDISDRMVELARGRLGDAGSSEDIRRGDLLDAASYRFANATDGFDVIYAFDAVQQLPPERQYECCRLMLEHVRPGGVLVVFDHDARSPYGRSMARKKFLTRYLGFRLVPRYYCNAKYPPLAEFAQRLNAEPGISCRLIAATDSPKMALVATRAGPERQ